MSKFSIKTPTGRIVQGNPVRPNTKDIKGNPLLDKDGKPREDYYIGLAVNKTDSDWARFERELYQGLAENFPELFSAPGVPRSQNFIWKILNGDASPQKEGHAGCWIIRISSGFPPRYFQLQNGKAVPADPAVYKKGDYVQAYVTIGGQNDDRNPGIYINHGMLLHVGYGDPIISGPDPDSVFDVHQQLPQGASSTPQAGNAFGGQQPQPQQQPQQNFGGQQPQQQPQNFGGQQPQQNFGSPQPQQNFGSQQPQNFGGQQPQQQPQPQNFGGQQPQNFGGQQPQQQPQPGFGGQQPQNFGGQQPQQQPQPQNFGGQSRQFSPDPGFLKPATGVGSDVPF